MFQYSFFELMGHQESTGSSLCEFYPAVNRSEITQEDESAVKFGPQGPNDFSGVCSVVDVVGGEVSTSGLQAS